MNSGSVGISDLPYEMQFRFLIDAPWDDIVSYCQTSLQAAQICQSEDFWKDKLRVQGWNPDELDLIDGPNPAVRYRTLMEINTGDNGLDRAIVLGQTRWIRANWRQHWIHYLDSFSIVDAMSRGHSEVIEVLRDSMDEADFTNILIQAEHTAVEENLPRIALQLNKIKDGDYLDILSAVPSAFHENGPEALEIILADAKAQGRPETIQDFAEMMLESDEIIILAYMLRTHRDEINVNYLFQTALTECPTAALLYSYL